jgi:hypothetical protein
MDWTGLVITAVILTVGFLAGWLKPTGLLGGMKPVLSGNQRLRAVLSCFMVVVPLMIFWTAGYIGVWNRLQINVEGKVISRKDLPQTPSTHGPTSVYRLQGSDGSIREYTATTNDPSLPRTIPVGAYVVKRKWELQYLLNGEQVDDFPLKSYAAFLIAGVACLVGASVLMRRGTL